MIKHIQIYYGKYINKLDHEIDSKFIHLNRFGTVSRRIEPGEPNFPSGEQYRFSLANLNPDGTQRFPLSFWESASRTQGEGATQPLQIYFRIEVNGGFQFLGLMNNLSYSKDNATVDIVISDVLDIVRKADKPLLASFEIDCELIAVHEPGVGRNDLDPAKSIDDEDVIHEALSFELILNRTVNDDPLITPITEHLGWTDNAYTSPRSVERSAYIQIEDITILTKVRFIQTKGAVVGHPTYNFFQLLEAVVWHNGEPQVVKFDDGVIRFVPPGQFLDRERRKLAMINDTGRNPVTLTLHDPDLGNDTDCILQYADIPLNENFLFGIPFTEETSTIQFNSDSYAYFDLIEKTSVLMQTLLNDVHSTDTEPFIDFFDFEKVTDKHRFVFWSDIKMFGWLESSLVQAVVNSARQCSAWLYTDRFGKVVIHSRSYHDEVLDGFGEPIHVPNDEWEPVTGLRFDHGFATYESKVAKDVIEISNLITQETKTILSSFGEAVTVPALRNKTVQLRNYRTHDLGVPAENETVFLKVLRYSPGNGSWPNSEILENFIPLAQEQLNLISKTFPWPTGLTRIKLGIQYINPVYLDSEIEIEKDLDYIIDDDSMIWWVRNWEINPVSLTTEVEIQLIGALNAET